jgi:hypothetical protein
MEKRMTSEFIYLAIFLFSISTYRWYRVALDKHYLKEIHNGMKFNKLPKRLQRRWGNINNAFRVKDPEELL